MHQIVCFDLDNTLLDQNSWYELNLALGMTPEEDQKLLGDFKNGVISYEEWMKKLLEIFKVRGQANRENIVKALSEYRLDPNAHEVVNNLRAKGYQIVLVSGSIDLLVQMVADELGIEKSKAVNEFIFDESDNLIDIKTKGNDSHAKLAILEEICTDLGVDVTDCICVGDGANDLEMFKKTGKGITFENSEIKSHAWKVVDGLRELSKIL